MAACHSANVAQFCDLRSLPRRLAGNDRLVSSAPFRDRLSMIKIQKFTSAMMIALGLFSAAPAPAADLELVGRELVRMLQDRHYARLPFNEKLSARFLERYLATLDGDKIYFLESEVLDIKRRHERSLHDAISTKTVMPIARRIFKVYKNRVTARVVYAKYLLRTQEFPFERDRSVLADRKDVSWPADGVALQKVWRDDVEALLLREMIRRERLKGRALEEGKPDPFRNDPSPKDQLVLRFERMSKTVKGTTDEDIANYFFSAVTKSYDPHSEYFSANEMAQFKIDVSNELVGIGASLDTNDQGEIEVQGIVNDGPADRQGELTLGDRIIAVSPENDNHWKDILFKPLDKVIGDILGKENAPVGLRIRRLVDGAEETVEIAIPRGVVTMKDELTTAKIYEFSNGDTLTRLAVMTIPSFYFDFDDSGSRVSVDVERILARLKKEKIDGLALDLRWNSGGSLPEVQRLTGFFVGRGPVVQVKSISGQVTALNSLHRKPLYDGPLIVLTSKSSASATEILAGALQDYNRAVVVGASSTYGKGTVQKAMDISDYMPIFADRERAGWLKLTFQKYYRVSGSSVQIKGVTPDLILPDLSDAGDRGEGSQKYVLPHDVIRPSPRFGPRDRSFLFIPALREKSRIRVSENQYFKYLNADIERARMVSAANSVSLNLPKRLAALQESEDRRKARTVEQLKRFAAVEENDQKSLKILRLTLDDLKTEPLPLFDLENTDDAYLRSAADEIADLEKTLKWPSGIDAVKREGLDVLQDLVNASRARLIAGFPIGE